MGKRRAKKKSEAARQGSDRGDVRVRTSRRGRPKWWPKLVGSGGGGTSGADAAGALKERIGRIRLALYDLYNDLEYFKSSPPEHRALLRRSLDWPDVGHITSLARSLAEEDRFADWLKFNGMLHGPVGTTALTGRRGPVGTTALTGRRGPAPAKAIAREKSA